MKHKIVLAIGCILLIVICIAALVYVRNKNKDDVETTEVEEQVDYAVKSRRINETIEKESQTAQYHYDEDYVQSADSLMLDESMRGLKFGEENLYKVAISCAIQYCNDIGLDVSNMTWPNEVHESSNGAWVNTFYIGDKPVYIYFYDDGTKFDGYLTETMN